MSGGFGGVGRAVASGLLLGLAACGSDGAVETGASPVDTADSGPVDTGDTGPGDTADTGALDAAAPGDLWITEVMARPSGVDDAVGEWVEVYNTTAAPVNLAGWALQADAATSPLGPVTVPAKGYAVIGASADWGANGGVPVDTTWTGLSLGDTEGRVALLRDGVTIAELAWSADWPGEDGAALQLDPTATAGDRALVAFWCAATWALPSGDHGSPGLANGACPQIDHDHDGESADDGDCDDTDPMVNRRFVEEWNEVDDDCNLVVDNVTVPGLANWLAGTTEEGVGVGGLGLGDLDGDGADELLVGATAANGETGEVAVVPLAGFAGWTATAPSAVALSTVDGVGRFGLVPRAAADVSGDGVVDLVVGSAAGAEPPIQVWNGPLAAGALGAADTAFNEGGDLRAGGFALVDVDGDGVAEVVRGNPSSPGSVSVYGAHGGTVTLEEADAVLVGAGDQFGAGVVDADVDGDGYGDLIVGAPLNDDHSVDAGAVFVVPGASLGGTAAVADVAAWTLRGEHGGGTLGGARTFTVADFDGDGALDVAAGAPATSEAYVFYGLAARSGTANAGAYDVLVMTTGMLDLGQLVVAGDVDGDGAPNLLVGAASGPAGPAVYDFDALPARPLDPEVDAAASFATPGQDELTDALAVTVAGTPVLVLAIPTPEKYAGNVVFAVRH